MSRRTYAIGVLGGMGTYASIHLFQQYAAIFPAEKEWERPRIIIDNRCTMPSRVRAALYGECKEQLIDEMSDSVRHFVECGCDRILLACNTAHLFLPDIYCRVPGAEGTIINIIDVCADGLREMGIDEACLLASEGTIDSGIYQKACEMRGIRCEVPQKEDYSLIRDCIEAVKKNRYTEAARAVFLELLRPRKVCILGCTELPILYEKYRDLCSDTEVYDPVFMALNQIRKDYDEEPEQ